MFHLKVGVIHDTLGTSVEGAERLYLTVIELLNERGYQTSAAFRISTILYTSFIVLQRILYPRKKCVRIQKRSEHLNIICCEVSLSR